MAETSKFILRSQINKIIETLTETGIPSKEVVFSKELRSVLSIELPLTLLIKGSNFHFTIGYFSSLNLRQYTAEFFPSERPSPQTTHHEKYESLLAELLKWGKRVAKELSEPDPWALLGEGQLPRPELIDRIGEEQKFNERELQAIQKSLQGIRNFLQQEQHVPAEHFRVIEERLNFLESEAKTQGKKQWMYVAIGVIVTIADGLAMSPDQTHKLFTFLSDLSKHLFMKLLS